MITDHMIAHRLESVSACGITVVNSKRNLTPEMILGGDGDLKDNPAMIQDTTKDGGYRPVTDEDILNNPYAGGV